MAARAHLRITKELGRTFTAARKSEDVRYVMVKVQKEKLVLHKEGKISSSEAEDFDAVVTPLGEKEACFIFFRLDDKNEDGSDNWLFVTYVPDNAPVRDKMMYASSVDDLTDQLGSKCYSDTYSCCDKVDLSYEAYKASKSRRRGSFSAVMTEKEKFIKDEKSLDRTTVAAGMRSLPFKINDDIRSALKALGNERSFVAIKIVKSKGKEKCVLDKDIASDGAIEDASFGLEPRFCVTQSGDNMVFVFFCPDDAKAQYKMLYATAKKAVLDNCEQATGKKMAFALELTDIKEFKKSVQYSISAKDDNNASATISQKMTFAKPSAAGRRRPRRGGRRGLIRKPGAS